MKWILFILTMTVLVSCSGSKKAGDAGEVLAGIELNDSEQTDSAEDLFADDEEISFDEGMTSDAPVDDMMAEAAPAPVEEIVPTEEPVSMSDEPVVTTEEVVMNEPETMVNPMTTEIDAAGSIRSYTVQKNETLMMIAFKIYGDYAKWHSLQNQNPGIDSNRLAAGMEIKYLAPTSEFNWNPQGSPYLIKWGDTLARISGNVYGNQNRWKDIWDNNKPLIKDPNRIFAGFTIYYIEGEREVASR